MPAPAQPVASSNQRRQNAYERVFGLIWGLIKALLFTGLFIVVGALMSILVEWVGMTIVWPEQKTTHAKAMLSAEIAYLDKDFSRTILDHSPSRLARQVAARANDVLEPNARARYMIDRFSRPRNQIESTAINYVKAAYQNTAVYIAAAHDIALVFLIRLVIVVLSLPFIALVAYAFLMDGLCERELRKAGAGRESTKRHHHFKRLISAAVLLPFILYLSSPVATHPSVMLLPITLLIAPMLYFTASNYKKFW